MLAYVGMVVLSRIEFITEPSVIECFNPETNCYEKYISVGITNEGSKINCFHVNCHTIKLSLVIPGIVKNYHLH